MSSQPADILTTAPPRRGDALIQWLCGPWPVALLFGGFLLLGVTAALQKTPTFDEPVHVTGGYSYWAYNDYRLHPENGNWSQRWVALPVWLVRFSFPTKNDPSFKAGNLWAVSDNFFYGRTNNADNMIQLGRLAQAVPAAALAMLVYLWSCKLFGRLGGLISLTLCVCSPTILGYGFFVTSEIGVSLFLLAATWAVWTLLHRVTPATIGLTAFAVSGAALTKFSGLVILPIAVVLVCARLTNSAPWIVDFRGVREVRGRGRQLLLMVALTALVTMLVVLIVWASYGFRYSIFGPSATAADQVLRPWESLDIGTGLTRSLVDFAREKHLLPEGFLYGFSHVVALSQARPSFLNGAFSMSGFRSYFAFCLALKTPLTMFVLLLFAATGALRLPGRTPRQDTTFAILRSGLYELTPLLALFCLYLAFAFSSNMNLGHRYIMPVYPVMFILAGGAAVWFRGAARIPNSSTNPSAAANDVALPPAVSMDQTAKAPRIARAVILGMLLVSVAEPFWTWPNYTAYFNILAGGRRHAYRHMVDSSLDWGQDLGGLVKWLAQHPNDSKDKERVFVSYFGSADTVYYGLRARLLPSFNKWPRQGEYAYRGGLYCVSATNLQSVYSEFPGRWNPKYEEIYQNVRPLADAYLKVPDDPAARSAFAAQAGGEQDLLKLLDAHEHLRFGRLCAFLRAREPDDDVGGSILIYRLTDDDVRQALEGPLPAETIPQAER